jgi:hypothetical protein
MPNALTHKFISEIVRNALDDNTKKILLEHDDDYSLGSLGPDILMGLMLDVDPLFSGAGESLHTEYVFAGICNIANYLVSNKDDKCMFSYLAGVITHYVADSTIHPYVYYYIENRLKRKYTPSLASTLHCIVETEMDVYIDNYYLKGKHTNSFWLFKKNKRLMNTVYRYYLEINKDIFNLVLKPKDVRRSYRMFRFLLFVCHRHRNGRIRFWLAKKVDNLLKAEHLLIASLRPRQIDKRFDYLNMSKLPYRSIHKERFSAEVRYSFPEMIEQAKIRGIDYINKLNRHIFNGVPLNIQDFELNYNGSFNSEYLLAVEEGIVEARKQETLLST